MMEGKQKTYLMLAAFALILTVLCALLWFTLSDIKKAADNIVSAEQAGLFDRAAKPGTDNFQKTYPDRKTQLDSLGQYFVDSKNPIDLSSSGTVRQPVKYYKHHCASAPAK